MVVLVTALLTFGYLGLAMRSEDFPPPGSSSIPPVSLLGAWGCSQVTHEFSAFHRKPAPFGTWSGRYGGATVADWYAALSSRAAKDYWVIFRRTLDRHPGTTDLYAEICVGGANRISEAEFEQMTEEIFREIRRVVGPEIRIWATGMADWEGEVCSLAGPRGAEIAARLADHVVALGLAQRGPTLAPWKPSELESGLCHPNDAGEDRAAAEIVAFFTS